MNDIPTLRVARPTDNLEAVIHFYRDGLGLTVLCQFENHEGFDGVMFGWKNAPYHLEFTHARGHTAGCAPTADNLLVFYLADRAKWEAVVQSMRDAGFEPVASFNPFWERNGLTFEDPDGYRVVLQNSAWSQSSVNRQRD